METPRSLSDRALRGILVPALVLVGFGATAAASSAHDISSQAVPSAHRVCRPWLYRSAIVTKRPWLYATHKSPWLYGSHKRPWLYGDPAFPGARVRCPAGPHRS